MPSRSKAAFEQVTMRHQEYCPNFEHPSLNNHGMMWFRDNKVEIGDKYCSIITIYQPLYDARDAKVIELYLDHDDPTLLHHIHPTVPVLMQKDYLQMHEQDTSLENPKVYSETKRNHKFHKCKMAKNDNLKLQLSDYRLPFPLTTESFDEIKNYGLKIKKHLRCVEVESGTKLNIVQKCYFVFWKVMIAGETIYDPPEEIFDDVIADAEKRMMKASAKMKISK